MIRSAAGLALLLTTAGFVALLLVYYPSLPDRVASHFDTAGNADGYMAKKSFLVLTLCLALGDGALFFGLTWMLGRLPASMINVPHRDYWLADERREATVRQLGTGLLWFGAVTQLFLLAIFWMTLQVNLGESHQLSNGLFWPLLIGYLGYTAGWVVLLYRRYRLPEEAGGSSSG